MIVRCTIKNNRRSLLMSATHMAIINSSTFKFVNNTTWECTLCVSHGNISLLHTIIILLENVGNFSVLSDDTLMSQMDSYSLNSGSFLIRRSTVILCGASMFEGYIQKCINTAAAVNYF